MDRLARDAAERYGSGSGSGRDRRGSSLGNGYYYTPYRDSVSSRRPSEHAPLSRGLSEHYSSARRREVSPVRGFQQPMSAREYRNMRSRDQKSGRNELSAGMRPLTGALPFQDVIDRYDPSQRRALSPVQRPERRRRAARPPSPPVSNWENPFSAQEYQRQKRRDQKSGRREMVTSLRDVDPGPSLRELDPRRPSEIRRESIARQDRARYHHDALSRAAEGNHRAANRFCVTLEGSGGWSKMRFPQDMEVAIF
ncbi:hypothetical protein LTR95_004240 [Oleoguttula sp. CCFEE 5521]